MFQAISDNPWVTTAAVAAMSFAALALWLRSKPFLVGFFVLFTIEILADALRSGAWSPLLLLRSPWEGSIGIAFVLVGDFRYFLVTERFAIQPGAKAEDATAKAAWASSIALTLAVPILSAVANRALPARFSDPRWTYLTYEALFVALGLLLRFFILPRRLASASPSVRRWLLRVTGFEIIQYALWVASDVIILAGIDAGFALRIAPNVMYYALFLPFVMWTSPAEVGS